MNFETKFGSLQLKNPIIIASGTASRDGKACYEVAQAGAGAVITKTVEEFVSPVPRPCIASYPGGLLNCEGWSDLSPKQWADHEVKQGKYPSVPLIANVYGEKKNRAEFTDIIQSLEASGIDGFEVALGEYAPDPDDQYLPWTINATSLPVIAKIPHSFDSVYLKTAKAAVDQDIVGLSTMDSLGPALMINIYTGRPYFGSHQGDCRISGSAIRPLAIRKVADLAYNFDLPILGIGGISTAKDVIEMLMAGATAIGMATKPITASPSYYEKLLDETGKILQTLGYSKVQDVRGIALQFYDQEPNYTLRVPDIELPLCTGCKRCERSCPYKAIKVKNKKVTINKLVCYGCGLCVSVCPTNTLSIAYPE